MSGPRRLEDWLAAGGVVFLAVILLLPSFCSFAYMFGFVQFSLSGGSEPPLYQDPLPWLIWGVSFLVSAAGVTLAIRTLSPSDDPTRGP